MNLEPWRDRYLVYLGAADVVRALRLLLS